MNIGSWDENKKIFVENCNDIREIKNTLYDIKVDLAGFKGRVFGVAAGISFIISVIIGAAVIYFTNPGLLN